MPYKDQKINLFYKKREKINLIRPLLVLNRFQILKMCICCHLPIYVDSTNRLTNFRRNRLRYQILPLFKIFFNPKIDVALTKFLSIINDENQYFTNFLKNINKFIKVTNIQKLKWVIFLPYALQRKFYQQLLISHFKSLTFNEIEFLLKLNIFLFK